MALGHGIHRASSLVLILAVLWGCAVQGAGTGRSETDLPVGYRYTPTLSPGLASPEAAKQDLARLLGTSEQAPWVKYYGHPTLDTPGDEPALRALLSGGQCDAPMFWYTTGVPLYIACPTIPVLEDRIEVSPQVVFYFTNLLETPIVVERTSEYPTGAHHAVGQVPIGSIVRPYRVQFPGQMSFVFADFADAKRFADDVFVIQQVLQKQNDERRARFEASAAQYRALTVKPPVSEEQRRSIVQANALVQQKQYAKAVELYQAALDLDPVSYPAAHFNLALLFAQTGRFASAIATMQQYLQLSPEAADARSAQDKIYEWELLVPPKK